MPKPKKEQTVATKATAEQIQAWKQAAEAEGRTLSGWIRRVADLAAEAQSNST